MKIEVIHNEKLTMNDKLMKKITNFHKHFCGYMSTDIAMVVYISVG